MTSLRFGLVTLCFAGLTIVARDAASQDEPPRSLDPRLKIELFAENPQIVTPTGIDVDHAGRVWAIESNTHFPPEGYKGHPTDRVLVMQDTDGDCKADKITVFKDGLTHTMSVAVKPVWLEMGQGVRAEGQGTDKPAPSVARPSALVPQPYSVFIATRREILLCTDTDGDLKCDETKRLVHLETTGNYPHNGLAGFAFDALGNMFFGFGENLGADYKLIGSDGTTLSGGGEGGNVYRCRPDGSKLERWATGFWNPHASCFDAFGRLFTLDNDPDSRPPCRLLHIIPGGDYGYKFRNGRKGTHPFTSWNGEIPGTLPMVSGTGEAPSGIVCYESDGFPEDYLGTLLVGSWGDHRIDKFVLKPRGASFESLPQPVIKGGENFRPVGLALAPDGSLYVTDWVLKDYKLHGKGRVWRVSAKEDRKREPITENPREVLTRQRPITLVERRSAARRLTQTPEGRHWLVNFLNDRQVSERRRIEALWALSTVPMAVEKLTLLTSGNDPALFLTQFDRVTVAAAELLGTPQLSLVPPVIELAATQPRESKMPRLSASVPVPMFPKNFVWQEALMNKMSGGPRTSGWEEFVWVHWAGHFFPLDHSGAGKFAGVYYFMVLETGDPFLLTLLVQQAKRLQDKPDVTDALEKPVGTFCKECDLYVFLFARSASPKEVNVARRGLNFPSIRIQRAAVQWIGEENLKELRPEVEKVLASEPMTGELFMACLASLSMLDGVPPAEFEKAPPVQHILPIVQDAQRSASLRAIALRMLPPTLKELDGKLLGTLVASTDEGLRREAVRTLGHSPISERDPLLRGIAADESLDANLRADAVAGLAGVDHHAKLNDATRDLLIQLVRGSNNVALRFEAIRSLRGPAVAKQGQPAGDPKIVEALKELRREVEQQIRRAGPDDSSFDKLTAIDFALGERFTEKPSVDQPSTLDHQPSAAAGRRTFFHTNSAGCFKCHTVGGRGGQVGPDLTVIARTMDRQKLAESILEPSKEISPQFTTWAIETTNGKVVTGMLMGEELNGDLRLGDNTGKVFFVPFKDIETRTPLKTSIMPEKLHELMTPSEFRDLVAYLETLK